MLARAVDENGIVRGRKRFFVVKHARKLTSSVHLANGFAAVLHGKMASFLTATRGISKLTQKFAMAAQCDYCGTKTELDGLFHKSRLSFSRQVEVTCPACMAKRRASRRKSNLLWILGSGIFGVVVAYLSPNSPLGWIYLNLVLFQLVSMLCIIPHELAHVAAAKLIGWKPFQVIIGSGKIIYRKDFCGIDVVFKVFPSSGLTISAPEKRNYSRIKHPLYILAGPVVNLLLAIAAWLWIFRTEGWPEPTQIPGLIIVPLIQQAALAQVFLVSNLVILAFNLIPRRISTEAGQIRNDGLALLRVPRLSSADIEKLYASYYFCGAYQWFRRKNYAEAKRCLEVGLSEFSQNEHMLNLHGLILLHEHNYIEARESLIRVLANTPGASIFRLVLLNNIAYTDALIGDAALLDEADRYSKESWEQAPWVPSFNGTRGVVLVEKGQLEEGIALLKTAFEKDEEIQSKATNACHLSIAEKKRGNLAESERYLKTARELDPGCSLLSKMDAL